MVKNNFVGFFFLEYEFLYLDDNIVVIGCGKEVKFFYYYLNNYYFIKKCFGK